ncbi:MAG: endogenous inhibitor of DNA gyrase (YacG/DUF329 family) [Janthinobacterium sp.]|jgi:endogenous inhibitor of DNA gyrase (YacG/DUF329 family)
MTIVNCPGCARKVEWNTANQYRPFCSERCKQIDLGAWADEKYAIPAVNQAEDQQDAAGEQHNGQPGSEH